MVSQAPHRELADGTPAAPSLLLALLEAPRALSEASSLLPASGFLSRLEQGDGHSVLTIPGFMASDRSMRTVRRYLATWGYAPQRWDLGRNDGLAQAIDIEGALDRRLEDIFESGGGRVSIVGWSLGGLLGRELARRHPDKVRNVIALGSPLGHPKATNAWRLYEFMSGTRVSGEDIDERIARLREPLPGIPTTAIYSKSDAVVSWKIAMLPVADDVENIGVNGSHFGMGFNPAVLYLIADRLRQPEGAWRPFKIAGLRSLFFQ